MFKKRALFRVLLNKTLLKKTALFSSVKQKS
jgi:hypothetical protein